MGEPDLLLISPGDQVYAAVPVGQKFNVEVKLGSLKPGETETVLGKNVLKL
jgi:hypothetical protein